MALRALSVSILDKKGTEDITAESAFLEIHLGSDGGSYWINNRTVPGS